MLSAAHPVGRFKAAFFRALGYTPEQWELLANALVTHLHVNDAQPDELTNYGQKYRVHGTITGPDGREAALVAIWIVRTNENASRFVTAFPGGEP